MVASNMHLRYKISTDLHEIYRKKALAKGISEGRISLFIKFRLWFKSWNLRVKEFTTYSFSKYIYISERNDHKIRTE